MTDQHLATLDQASDDGRPRYEVEVIRDLRIPIDRGGAWLAADLVRPRTGEPVPALLTMVPYRKDTGAGIEYSESQDWFARRGYAALLVDFQGTGSSTGQQRPPFDPGEAEDAAAAIEWIAQQPWCSGSVGMWGASYGSIMSMRTASLNPSSLKAIVPVIGTPAPGSGFVHPAGLRGGLAAGYWGTATLLSQLLPPVLSNPTEVDLEAWRERLRDTEPYLFDLWRHPPGDPVWQERAINAAAITTPALCVAGWRDLFCDGSVRAYEEMHGPKKLLAGPWMHTLPHMSPFATVEIRRLMLDWWNRWLRGIDNGVMDEPPVTLYIQGAHPQWRSFASWPPGEQEVQFGTSSGTTLARIGNSSEIVDDTETVVARCVSDPTAGVLSGLWFTATAGAFGLPLDQSDDDLRGLSLTSDPLATDIVVAGQPVVAVTAGTESTFDRLVARLADVDPDGRSTMITTGGAKLPVAEQRAPGQAAGRHTVAMAPAAYRIPAGHRVRVVLSDSDFPRMWPAPQVNGANRVLELTGLTLTLPTVADDEGQPVALPAVDAAEIGALGIHIQPRWRINRDVINDAIEITIGWDAAAYTAGREHVYEYHCNDVATVHRAVPSSAALTFHHVGTARLSTGQTISAQVQTRISQALLRAQAEVRMDGETVFTRTWEA